MRLILASASPRRRELLGLLGLPFEVIPSHYEEPPCPTAPTSISQFVTTLAVNKALEVARRASTGIVIGADTVVTLADGDIGVPMGKPLDAGDAAAMLRKLAGATHSVYTGVAVVDSGETETAWVQTHVTFRPMTDAQIAAYVASGEPMDKAGAYGAQGLAAPYISRFDGDFFNVVGLPICTLAQMLERRMAVRE